MTTFLRACTLVTDVVYDHLLIEINHQQSQTKNFEYRICTRDEKLVRQGSFRGPRVQLRLSLMDTGNYQLLLSEDGSEWEPFGFEKKATQRAYA